MVKMSYYTEYTDYTDGHVVDEDSMTIVAYGGAWPHDREVGIMFRDMLSGAVWSDAASRYRTNRTIQKKNKHHSPSLEGE